MLHTRIFRFNPLETTCTVLWTGDSKSCVVVDPGMWGEDENLLLEDFLRDNGLTPEAILLTHGHADHILGVKFLLGKFHIPVYINEGDRSIPTPFFPSLSFETLLGGVDTLPARDGSIITSAGIEFTVLHTPGHTPGSVCYWIREHNLLLSGDTLFAGTIGRTDLPGGDYDVLIASIKGKLLDLPGETDVVPGHGQPTSISREGMYNPFLEPFNEKADDPVD